jgi:hypothetical protein
MSAADSPAPDAEHPALLVLSEVLQRDAVSPSDDFFLLGGHSLLLVRVIGKLRKEHGLALDARQFLTNSQVAALMAACRPISAPDGGGGTG